MSPHGPDADTFLKATSEELKVRNVRTIRGAWDRLIRMCMFSRLTDTPSSHPTLTTPPTRHTPAQPTKFDGGLAFMFETCFTLRLSPAALQGPHLEKDYVEDCWARLPKFFTGGKPAEGK